MYFVDATIYHNPKCSTSRKTLQALRDAGIEPTVVKYLDEPYTREQLVQLFADAGLTPSEAVRKREALDKELDLASATDDQILDAMVSHPRPRRASDRGDRQGNPHPAAVREARRDSLKGGRRSRESGTLVARMTRSATDLYSSVPERDSGVSAITDPR